jgi:hypothetical protein
MLRQDLLRISDVSWLPKPAHINPSSLRGASWSEQPINLDVIKFEANKRRGNLPSLTSKKEPFILLSKNTSLQPQSREIASGIQQRFSCFTFNKPSTEPRNDEVWCEGRELQILQRGNVCES